MDIAEYRGPMRVFISAVSDEFGDKASGSLRGLRSAIGKKLRDKGVAVHEQKPYPNGLTGGTDLFRLIGEDEATLCLIGHHGGAGLPVDGRTGALCELPATSSWTQAEYWLARKALAQGGHRLWVYLYVGPDETGLPRDECQGKFRDDVCELENHAGGRFYKTFRDRSELLDIIDQQIKAQDGILGECLNASWMMVRQHYRAGTVAAWQALFPDSYDEPADAPALDVLQIPETDTSPFIASQGFHILRPDDNGDQLRFLSTAAFMPGRESNAEAQARAGSLWLPREGKIGREDIVGALRGAAGSELESVALERPSRLFLISGGGVGKTTNLQWFEYALNRAADEMLAMRVRAGEIEDLGQEAVFQKLGAILLSQAPPEDRAWWEAAVGDGLDRDLRAGRVVVIIDGLDHVEKGALRFLLDLQQIHENGRWANCAILLAGRPHALIGHWNDRPTADNHKVAACRWRFIEPAEFTPNESRMYLGRSGRVGRYDVVVDNLGHLLIKVPRILEYVRKQPVEKLAQLRSAADIYYYAIIQLVGDHILKENQEAKGRAPITQKADYFVAIFAAIAFASLCVTTDPARRLYAKNFRMQFGPDELDELKERLRSSPTLRANLDRLEADLAFIGRLAAVMNNGILESDIATLDGLAYVIWANRTIQQFLAAHWLARYAAGGRAMPDLVPGSKTSAWPGHPALDAARFRNYVFFPGADLLRKHKVYGPELESTDITYELNQFLAEMPTQAMLPECWLAAVNAWYDPGLFPPQDGVDGPSPRRMWATEMIFRSWPRLMECANLSVGDWWDVSYTNLISDQRATASPHRDRERKQVTFGCHNEHLARRIVERFLGEFQAILDEQQGKHRKDVARRLTDPDRWVNVEPKGPFRLGVAPGAPQGCPTRKVHAYWEKLLDQVKTHELTPEEAATKATPTEWFVGPMGDVVRDLDIGFLKNELKLLAEDQRDGDETANRVWQAIEDRWLTADEVPIKQPKTLAPFSMHSLPVLHEDFWLFAPGHRELVEIGLKESGVVPPPPHPDANHPVSFISWVDAWAFCMWGRWKDNGTIWGLRLPHEPEWEYAARWRSKDEMSGDTDRWWWGNDFYAHDDSPVEENISRPEAHADGRPGQTRAPAGAMPNGLGFRDILGNLWEWMATIYDQRSERQKIADKRSAAPYSPDHPQSRPPVAADRVVRGGLWYYLNIVATCTNRWRSGPTGFDCRLGFRLVREARKQIGQDEWKPD